MKKHLKLGLVAIALLGAVGAFAMSGIRNGWYEPDGVTPFQGNVDQNCSTLESTTCAIHYTNDLEDEIRYDKQP